MEERCCKYFLFSMDYTISDSSCLSFRWLKLVEMMPSTNLKIDAGGIPQVNSYLKIHLQNKTEIRISWPWKANLARNDCVCLCSINRSTGDYLMFQARFSKSCKHEILNSLAYLKTHPSPGLTAGIQVVLHQKFGKQRWRVKQKPYDYTTFTIILINMTVSLETQE